MAKSRSVEQSEIPGTEQERIPQIETAAKRYGEARGLRVGRVAQL